ncbi:hypothetical protein BG003_007825 [Podila horticola]|nr:hypothetical protein BG003_007825 [Podila horticola]
MSFQHSCQDISLENNSVLVARCRKADGSWNDSSLDLDDILGNDDGYFVWNGQQFSLTAKNVHLNLSDEVGPNIEADLPCADGSFRERQRIILAERIENDDGNLVFI